MIIFCSMSSPKAPVTRPPPPADAQGYLPSLHSPHFPLTFLPPSTVGSSLNWYFSAHHLELFRYHHTSSPTNMCGMVRLVLTFPCPRAHVHSLPLCRQLDLLCNYGHYSCEYRACGLHCAVAIGGQARTRRSKGLGEGWRVKKGTIGLCLGLGHFRPSNCVCCIYCSLKITSPVYLYNRCVCLSLSLATFAQAGTCAFSAIPDIFVTMQTHSAC